MSTLPPTGFAAGSLSARHDGGVDRLEAHAVWDGCVGWEPGALDPLGDVDVCCELPILREQALIEKPQEPRGGDARG